MYPYVYLNQTQFVPMEEEGLPLLAMIGAVLKGRVFSPFGSKNEDSVNHLSLNFIKNVGLGFFSAESTFLYFMTGLKKSKGFKKIWQTITLFLHQRFVTVLKPIP